MRCRGLDDNRMRCTAEPSDGTGYCEQHLREQTHTGESVEMESPPPMLRFPFIGWMGARSSRAGVPDDANFAIPRWLKRCSTPEVIHHLLHHPSSLTRWLAAYTLRRRRDPVAIEPLWQVLHDEPYSLVRQQAAVALGKIGTAAALSPLIEALWHDRDAGVRQACAIALGNLGYPVAARDLATALQREQAALVRWDCVLALGQVGDRTVEPLLAELAPKERSEVVRRAYGEAISEIRQRVRND